MNNRFPLILGALGAFGAVGVLGTAGSAQAAPKSAERPRLVVLLSIDQCRADYMTRFTDLYLPAKSKDGVGGFRYLQSRGAWYPDCRYQHSKTVTGVGHAILSTGAQPAISGIVGNSWFDRSVGKSVYVTDDAKSTVVGAVPDTKEKPMSPAPLLVSTVGDELELATGGLAKTVSVSLKDRAAIMLGGHRADAAIWLDEGSGQFVSSSWYCKTGRLPEWVSELNGRRIPDELRKTPWTPSVSAEALKRAWKPKNGNPQFSHALTGKDYTPFTVSPSGNDYTFQAALAGAKAENLGQDEIPDLLTINLASNDYVGHAYGPDSPEVLDISVQTDRLLARFLNDLEKLVPGGLKEVTFAISSDHGVANVPEAQAESGVPALRAISANIRKAAEDSMDKLLGAGDWIISADNGELYFNDTTLERTGVARSRAEAVAIEAIRAVPGVYGGYGKTSILQGLVPNTIIGRRLAPTLHPARSGDVVIILDPQWLSGSAPTGTGTSHGTPYTYDTNVPLLMAGWGVKPGTHLQPVSPAQIAPSLSYLLQIARPSGADEPLLPGLLERQPDK